MHDNKAIRENPDVYVAGWSSRGVDDAADLVARILALDVDLRAAQTTGQEALAKRNAASKAIGAAMGKKDMAEADRLKAEVETLKTDIAEAGEADSLQSPDGENLFRSCSTKAHHHHLICRECGETVELEAHAVEEWARLVGAEHGFAEIEHVVDLFGICARCREAR